MRRPGFLADVITPGNTRQTTCVGDSFCYDSFGVKEERCPKGPCNRERFAWRIKNHQDGDTPPPVFKVGQVGWPIKSFLESVNWESMSLDTERAGKKAYSVCAPLWDWPTDNCIKLANEAMTKAHIERVEQQLKAAVAGTMSDSQMRAFMGNDDFRVLFYAAKAGLIDPHRRDHILEYFDFQYKGSLSPIGAGSFSAGQTHWKDKRGGTCCGTCPFSGPGGQQPSYKNGKWVCEPCKRPPGYNKITWCHDPRPGKKLVAECIDGKLVCRDLSPEPSGTSTDLTSKIKGPPLGIPTPVYLIGAAVLAAILLLRR